MTLKNFSTQNLRRLLGKLPIQNRLHPVSRSFGLDRGTPIDRHYIELFLRSNQHLINGTVIEIAESTYTRAFGAPGATPLILHSVPCENADLVLDLTSDFSENALADCIILTQTFPFIFNLDKASRNCIQLLKPGGSLIITVPGITQISRYDMDRWGQYWSFTTKSIQRLFEPHVPSENIRISHYGNVFAASAFLYGITANELAPDELNYIDNDYQMLIGAVVTRPK